MDKSIAEAMRKRAQRLHENHVLSLGDLPPPPTKRKRAVHYRHWCAVVDKALQTPLKVAGPIDTPVGTQWFYLEPLGRGFVLTGVRVRRKDPQPQVVEAPVKVTAHAVERIYQRLDTEDVALVVAELELVLSHCLRLVVENARQDAQIKTPRGMAIVRVVRNEMVVVTWVDESKLKEDQR